MLQQSHKVWLASFAVSPQCKPYGKGKFKTMPVPVAGIRGGISHDELESFRGRLWPYGGSGWLL